MLNLLVVDDEPFITRGVCELLTTRRSDRLLVWAAFSGREAVDIMERVKIDILLCDINMPDIDGMELQKIAGRRWSNTRVIFLTGHDESRYVRAALDNAAEGYVLKSEGDVKLLQIIDNTVNRVLDDQRQLLERVRTQRRMWQMSRMVAEDTMRRIFIESVTERKTLDYRLSAMDDPIDLDKPFYLCLMLAKDGGIENDVMAEWCQKLLDEKYRLLLHSDIGGYITLMLQPRGEEADALLLNGLMDYLQRMATDRLKTAPSIIICERMVRLEQAAAVWWGMSRDAASRCLQEGETLIYQPPDGAAPLCGDDGDLKQRLLRSVVRQDPDGFHQQIRRLMDAGGPMSRADTYALIYALLNDLDSHIRENREAHPDLSAYGTAEEAERQLHILADAVFAWRSTQGSRRTRAMALEIQQYIREHLNQDVSLTRLADIEGINPSYLSRAYREVTNQNLKDFITEERLRCAQRMLADRRVKIQDVCDALGMRSNSYFSYFFKKHMGISPQEYRDRQ